jgi:hypothetical protein
MDVSKRLKTYQEGLLVLALRTTFPERSADIHWNRPISKYLIEPDITVGRVEQPEAIVCVAHSDSLKDSDKKFWRNAAELGLAKGRLSPAPLLVNVLFEAHYKPELIRIMANAFDAQIRLIEDLGAELLVRSAAGLVTGPLQGLGQEQTLAYLETQHLTKPAARSEFARLVTRLREVLTWGTRRNAGCWTALASDLPSASLVDALEFEPRGALRRGACKLLCFDPAHRRDTLLLAGSDRWGQVEPFAVGLGWAEGPVRGKYRVTDPDLIAMARSFDPGAVCATLARLAPDVLAGMQRVAVEPCRRFGEESEAIVACYRERAGDFASPAALGHLIDECYQDPSLGGRVGCRRPWVIDLGLAAGKAVRATPQGFGLSQLARELKVADPDRIRFLIPQYNAQACPLSAEFRREIARVLSAQFQRLRTAGAARQVQARLLHHLAHTLVEVKLCTYRLFRPAEELFRQACLAAGFEVARARLPAAGPFAGSRALLGTDGLLIRKGNLRLFVKVQSGARNTHDKAKELCGRILLSLKESQRGVRVPCSTLLVLDGPFKADEARLCRAAGWDRVVAMDRVSQEFLNGLTDAL